ncbi:MAG: hypothetical protein U0414_22060 [Polyangiaceae bacterium]
MRALIAYRADQFLTLPPLVQIFVVLGGTALVIVAFAIALGIFFPSSAEQSFPDRVWWAVTLFSDGGTMASSPTNQRVLALAVTFSGILAMSFLTAAFASKMSARIDDLKSGHSPVVEHQHILVLGFDSKVTFLARELARSGQRLTVVVMADRERDKIEHALRLARRVPHNRARFVSRTGDPRSEMALLRVAADRTRSIIVVPPSTLADEETVHWALSTLLAVRRVVGPKYHGHVVVEARYAEAQRVIDLATEHDVAGPGALAAEVIASDDVIARMLAQSARQEGVYHALREMLSFVGSELYLERVPHAFVGKTFDEAHAALEGGVAVGYQLGRSKTVLCPARGDATTLGKRDRLVVLAERKRQYTTCGTLPEIVDSIRALPFEARPERVLVIGFNRTLERLVLELDAILAKGSEIRVVCCPIRNAVHPVLDRLRPRVEHVTLTHDGRRPIDVATAHASPDDAPVSARPLELEGTDAIVILGCEDENDDNGDASALSTLLSLRKRIQRGGEGVERIVTEVRDLRSAGYVAGRPRDLLVSSDVVAMLLAQAALEPSLAGVYKELLSPLGSEVFVRPRDLYVGDRDATFAEVMTVARARGEIALGLYPAARSPADESLRDVIEAGELGDERQSPVDLNPPRDAKVPLGPEGHVVVLARAYAGD